MFWCYLCFKTFSQWSITYGSRIYTLPITNPNRAVIAHYTMSLSELTTVDKYGSTTRLYTRFGIRGISASINPTQLGLDLEGFQTTQQVGGTLLIIGC